MKILFYICITIGSIHILTAFLIGIKIDADVMSEKFIKSVLKPIFFGSLFIIVALIFFK